MIPALFQDVVNVIRRPSVSVAPRDSLNNPVYGNPPTWPIVYSNIKVRIAFSGRIMVFESTGELIKPAGTLYFDPQFTIQPMDRIITVNCVGYAPGIEYVVQEVTPRFILTGKIDHFQAQLILPI